MRTFKCRGGLANDDSEHCTGPGPRQATPGVAYHEPNSKRECMPCRDACVWWYRACHAASKSALYILVSQAVPASYQQ